MATSGSPRHVVGTAPSRPRLVLVHGFTQSASCWSPVDGLLRRWADVVALDAPGHGTATGITLPFTEAASWLADAGGSGVWLGYSMGGRLALRVALDHPRRVQALVLVSASPGLADPDARTARRAADQALADHVEAVGVDTFLDEWLAQPLFAGLPPDRRHLEARRTNVAAGLAASLRTCGTGAMEPLWDRLGELRMPVLVVTGADDGKFCAIADEMAERIGPLATRVTVPGATHTVQLEQPAAFGQAVHRWWTETAGPALAQRTGADR